MLILYDYFRSSACYRVRIALNLKSIEYQTVPIHLINQGGEQHSEKYLKINPQGLVPALVDGDKVITQSLAIIGYLDENHPDPSLLPDDATLRARVNAFSLTIAADMHPLNNLRVLNYLTQELSVSQEQKTAWYQHWMHKGLSALEKQLQIHRLSGDFCFGEKPTLADICLVPQLYNARRFSCDLTHYPTLVRIDANCQKLSAFSKALPMETTA